MNKPKSLKAIVLSMALTAGMLSSANATAQEADRPGGLFGGGSFFDEFVGLFADNDDRGVGNGTGFDISTELLDANVEASAGASRSAHEAFVRSVCPQFCASTKQPAACLGVQVARCQPHGRQPKRKRDSFQRFGCFHLVEI